jgi:hypothetical protein
MKNVIIVDIDTERDNPLLISKQTKGEIPSSEEEAKEMVLKDIACVCEALKHLISIADEKGYHDKETLIDTSIVHLNTLL